MQTRKGTTLKNQQKPQKQMQTIREEESHKRSTEQFQNNKMTRITYHLPNKVKLRELNSPIQVKI